MRSMTDDWPDRSEVDQAWREVIASARSRESAHDWAVPWVEGELAHEYCPDAMVRDGLLTLHGFDLWCRDSDGLRRYQVDDDEVVVRYQEWIACCAEYDQDPEGWRRRRVELAWHAVARWRDARRAVARERGTG
jgi:hypothetical protein